MALLNAKRFTYAAAAVEAGRRYARENPQTAARLIDRTVALLNQRTGFRWERPLDGVSSMVKRAAIGYDMPSTVASTVPPAGHNAEQATPQN